MELPTAAEMRILEQRTIDDYGISSLILMENAGLSTVVIAEKLLGSFENTFCPIFVGPGNNGGDGLVIGRHLYQRHCRPIFFFLVPPEKFKGDVVTNFKIIEKLRLPYHIIDNQDRVATIPVLIKQAESQGLKCHSIFDAIFGIGLSRQIQGYFDDTIRFINSPVIKTKFPIIAVDIPSGLNSDTGEILGNCVRADYTVTFGRPKPGHYLFGSKAWIGKLQVADIGIPPELIYWTGIKTELASPDTLRRHCNRLRRPEAAHKGNHGHALILAGSMGSCGAAILAAKGALRAGAGLVSIASTQNNNNIFQSTLPEAMTLPLKKADKVHTIEDLAQIEKNIGRYTCIVLGPGLGQAPETKELVLKLYHDVELPMVIDADALNILAASKDKLHEAKGPRIFTPHPGELSRILEKSTEEIFVDRISAAKEACEIFDTGTNEVVMVVKGVGTIVYNNQGKRIINTSGNPGMATGGMGDVLSGIIGAFICQGMTPFAAAITGVYLHGYAADILFDKMGPGYYASEVADLIPAARNKLVEELFPLPTI